jgi:hypothetical protein
VVGLYYRIRIQEDLSDVTWKVGYVLLWTQIEMFAGVTAASMPAVRQFFSHQDRLMSWGSSLKRSIFGSSACNSSSPDRFPAHVATLREYESRTARSTEIEREKSSNGDIETGHARDSASTFGKGGASVSFKSVSTDSCK